MVRCPDGCTINRLSPNADLMTMAGAGDPSVESFVDTDPTFLGVIRDSYSIRMGGKPIGFISQPQMIGGDAFAVFDSWCRARQLNVSIDGRAERSDHFTLLVTSNKDWDIDA